MQRLGGFLITKLKQLHSRSLAQCISEQGIDAFSGEQGKILFVLWRKDKINQKELATETGLAKNTITVMLEKMEKNNLIKRITDEKDKRKKYLSLSEKGIECIELHRKAYEEWFKSMWDKFDIKEKEAFNILLTKTNLILREELQDKEENNETN